MEDGQDTNQAENQGATAGADARISELVSQIQGLKGQLDRREALDQEDRNQRQEVAQQQQQNNPDFTPEQAKEWNSWMAPRIAPFLAERDRVIIALADKLDEVETMRKVPEYADEEFAKNVSKHIAQTKKQRGVVLSRMDAITEIVGREEVAKRYGNGPRASDDMDQVAQVPVSRGRVTSPVESGHSVGTTRAASPQLQGKDLNDMSIEEMEKTFRDMPV